MAKAPKAYKIKARRTALRRFKITGTGKVMRRVQGVRHLRAKRSKRALRRASVPQSLPMAFANRIKRMLGLK